MHASDGTPIELISGSIIPDVYPVSEIILKHANGRAAESIALGLGMSLNKFDAWMSIGAPLNDDLALRLAEWSGTTSGYWWNVQRTYIKTLAEYGVYL